MNSIFKLYFRRLLFQLFFKKKLKSEKKESADDDAENEVTFNFQPEQIFYILTSSLSLQDVDVDSVSCCSGIMNIINIH